MSNIRDFYAKWESVVKLINIQLNDLVNLYILILKTNNLKSSGSNVETHSTLIKTLISTHQQIGLLFEEILNFINKNEFPEIVQLNQTTVELILPVGPDEDLPLRTLILRILIGEITPAQQKNKYTILTLLLKCIRIFPSHFFFEILQTLFRQNPSVVKDIADTIYSKIIHIATLPIVTGLNSFELDAVNRLLTPIDVFSDNTDYKTNIITQQITLVACPDIDDIKRLFTSYSEGFVSPSLELLLPAQSAVIKGQVAQQSIDVLIDIISRSSERYLFICGPHFDFVQW
jgi:hypothetical protein